MTSKSSCTSLNLKNVEVKFPYAPYDLQKNMMEMMIDSAQQKENALIDSPTGTGKTICLLTSLLAWRENYVNWKKAIKNPENVYNLELLRGLHAKAFGPNLDFLPDRDINESIPKIFYASRTHSQLSQVASALKKTAYNPQTILLASREQQCSNESVKNLHPGDLTTKCKSLVKSQQCQYYLGSQKIVNIHEFKHRIMDIEEIGNFSKEKKACAFYMTMDLVADAHIILLPYQYLIDERTRESQKINISNSIILFDEGHNVEGVCTESTSAEITIPDMMRCVSELKCILEEFRIGNVLSRLEGSERIEENEVITLKKCIENLIGIINKIPLSSNEPKNCVQAGSKIYDYMKESGFDNLNEYPFRTVEILQTCEKLVNSIDSSKKKSGKFGLSHFLIFYRLVKDSILMLKPDLLKYYRLNIQQRNVNSPLYQAQFSNNYESYEKVMSMWCLSAEVAITALSDAGARSIIFASGTLSPLESFAMEFGLGFKNRIENPHVINKDQLFIASVPHGPTNQVLNSSFQNRDSKTYMMELGRSILNICSNVPDGILIFFSGYKTLDDCINIWKMNDNIWSRIAKFKQPFVETKNKEEFKKSISQYEKSLTEKKGAVFFAVCRGKASEGIDFSDDKARAVVLCGIPFPNFKDPFVAEKKKILDNGKTFSSKGDAWYSQQAFRALNQALGRVIRHKNDYGAVFFLDERFSHQKSVVNLPVWIRSDVLQYDSFGRMLGDCRNFFKYHSGGKNDSSLIPKQLKLKTAIHYQTNNGILLVSNQNTNFQDPLQLSLIAPPVNKTDIDPLQIQSFWAKGKSSSAFSKEKDPLSLIDRNDREGISLKQELKPKPRAVTEQVQYKAQEENFATHLKIHSTSSSKRESLENSCSDLDPKKAKLKSEIASRFIDRIKRTLSVDDFENYKLILQKYQAKRYSQNQIIDKTAEILFTKATPENYNDIYNLFQTFGTFINSKNSQHYQDRLEEYRPCH